MSGEQIHTGLETYAEGLVLTGSLLQDVGAFFKLHDDSATWEHTLKVTSHAVRIARLFDVDPLKAEQAALLHDISNVIPAHLFLDAAREAGIEVFEEELAYPRILHQKLSRAMAQQIFEVEDLEVLGAIECHTTLKSGASRFEKVVFIADKVAWDQPEEHSYLNEVRRLVDEGRLDDAVLAYLDQIWNERTKLKLVHSHLIEARAQLKDQREAELDPTKRQLKRMYDHMDWANHQILEILDKEALQEERVLRLFAHVLSAESVWISRLQGEIVQAAVWPDNMKVDDLRSLATKNRERFVLYLNEVTKEQLRSGLSYVTSNGTSYTTEVIDILTHVTLHGSYHRGQIASMLRMGQLTPPVTDYVQYVRNMGPNE